MAPVNKFNNISIPKIKNNMKNDPKKDKVTNWESSPWIKDFLLFSKYLQRDALKIEVENPQINKINEIHKEYEP